MMGSNFSTPRFFFQDAKLLLFSNKCSLAEEVALKAVEYEEKVVRNDKALGLIDLIGMISLRLLICNERHLSVITSSHGQLRVG
jgi:hypothetical protein